MTIAFDLDAESRRVLEFDDLLDWIAGKSRTEPGAEAVRELAPRIDLAGIRGEHERVRQARRFRDEHGALVPFGLPDPRAAFGQVGILGTRLAPGALRDLARWCVVAAETARTLALLPPGDAAELRSMGQSIPDLTPIAERITEWIDAEGNIADAASPELRRVRSQRARLAANLRERLAALWRQPDADRVLRDDFVTQRNGRFVVPVRSDAARPVKGIVHGASSSGATQFVEPLETVEKNNELVALAEREQAEQQRLLTEWSESFRSHHEELRRVVSGVAALDAVAARAEFANEVDGIAPDLEPAGEFRLLRLRHPMLDRRLREEGSGCVPFGISLLPADQVLLLSGPNTGGKTVTLKAFGLAVLMAQSGIPLAAGSARLPLYHQLRADIGDHQSIDADLSTFSAHVQAVIDVLRDRKPPALLLFDEIGTGTEPGEGAALAQAVLEELAGAGVTVVATTHLASLKAWAMTTEGAQSAALEFDAESQRPTYRIVAGAAGASAGLDVAARLGVDEVVLQRARSYLGEEARTAEALLERLRGLISDLEDRREGLVEEHDSLERERLELREEERRSRLELEQRTKRALDGALEEFRRKGRRLLNSISDRREKKKAEREVSRAEGELRSLRAAREPASRPVAAAGSAAVELQEGMRVYVASLGRVGPIRKLRGDRIDVQLGAAVFSVGRHECQPSDEPSTEAPARTRPEDLAAATSATSLELLLIGKTVDEGLAELDRYLDRAMLDGLHEVRVVHGYGTGRLRAAVRQFLDGHAHVGRFRPGRDGEGGDGATVVELRQ